MNYPDTAAPHLSQAERLASLPVSAFVEIDDTPRDLSAAACGFVMPSIQRVRENDARLMARDHYAPPAPIGDDEDDEEQDQEASLYDFAVSKRRDSMREHSFRLPSQGSRADVRDAFRSMGVLWAD